MGDNAQRLFERSFSEEIVIDKWRHLLEASLPSEAPRTIVPEPAASAAEPAS